MTTNAHDRVRQLITTDTRWSVTCRDQYIVYIDDVSFDKLAYRNYATIVMAGDAILIGQWKDWLAQPVINTAVMPPVIRYDDTGALQQVSISLVRNYAGNVMFESGWCLLAPKGEARFSGSGAQFAKDCWIKNRCARMAITTAIKQDPYSGGSTRFVEVETGSTNLRSQVTYLDMVDRLGREGTVMDKKSGKSMAVKDWNGGDIVGAIRAGELSVSAPTGVGDTMIWTADEQTRLKEAFDHLAKIEASEAHTKAF